jgi:hypothetical protein
MPLFAPVMRTIFFDELSILFFSLSSFGITHFFKVGNQPGAGRAPSEPFLRFRAGSREVQTSEHPEPAKMVNCLFRRLGHDRYIQAAADNFSDIPAWHSLFGHRMIPGAFFVLLQRQPVEPSGVQPVHRGPAVESFTDIRRNTLLASQCNQVGDETLLEWVVNLRKPHYYDVYTTRQHRSSRQFRCCAGMGMVGVEDFFSSWLTWHGIADSRPGGDDQGTIRTGKRRAERRDREFVYLADLFESGEVVYETGMDYSIRLSGPAAQALEVFKIASMHLGAGRGQRSCACVGPGKTEYLMARVDEFRHNGGTYKSRGAGNENSHILILSMLGIDQSPRIW